MKKQIAVVVAVTMLLVGAMSYLASAQAGPGQGRGMRGKGQGGPMCDRMGKGMGGGGEMGGCMMCGMGMMGKGMEMMLQNPKAQKELGLTDDQKTKLKAIASEAKRKSIRGQADLKILHMDFMELMDSPKQDINKLNSKIDEMTSAMAAQMKIEVRAMVEANKVLTPDQVEKMKGMHKKMMMKGDMKRPGMKDHKGMGKNMGEKSDKQDTKKGETK